EPGGVGGRGPDAPLRRAHGRVRRFPPPLGRRIARGDRAERGGQEHAGESALGRVAAKRRFRAARRRGRDGLAALAPGPGRRRPLLPAHQRAAGDDGVRERAPRRAVSCLRPVPLAARRRGGSGADRRRAGGARARRPVGGRGGGGWHAQPRAASSPGDRDGAGDRADRAAAGRAVGGHGAGGGGALGRAAEGAVARPRAAADRARHGRGLRRGRHVDRDGGRAGAGARAAGSHPRLRRGARSLPGARGL
ncbi:MAG: hypothetical protein AVDCRST_MAG08-3952, partial [uncultured Acetobacteraceae bacterium]